MRFLKSEALNVQTQIYYKENSGRLLVIQKWDIGIR